MVLPDQLDEVGLRLERSLFACEIGGEMRPVASKRCAEVSVWCPKAGEIGRIACGTPLALCCPKGQRSIFGAEPQNLSDAERQVALVELFGSGKLSVLFEEPNVT